MRAYGRWNVTGLPDGETHVWEPDETTLGECLMLENESGQSFDGWVRDVGDNRAEACQILVWYLRLKAGRQEDRTSVNFPIRKLTITELVEEAPDPEAPAGSEPATPASSPDTSESAPGSGTD